MKPDSVALAEQEVVRNKIAAAADLRHVMANGKRILSSPGAIAAACLGAIVVGYLATGRSRDKRGRRKTDETPWSTVLATAQLLVPLIRIMYTARGMKPAPRRPVTAADRAVEATVAETRGR